MVKRIEKKTNKYSAVMYKYDDGIDPKDLLLTNKLKAKNSRLFHDIWLTDSSK
jgi:hypothetical protein